MTATLPLWMQNPVRSPAPSDAEHLALALEFFHPECGERYLLEHAPELLDEFERLSEEA